MYVIVLAVANKNKYKITIQTEYSLKNCKITFYISFVWKFKIIFIGIILELFPIILNLFSWIALSIVAYWQMRLTLMGTYIK